MLIKIAWRNIWRSTTRSLVVITAIVIGIWSVIFLISFSAGFVDSYINNAIENEISHIQVHHPEYVKDNEVKYYMRDAADKVAGIQEIEGVKAATVRTLTYAMISSSHSAKGLRLKAIEPSEEAKVTNLDTKVVEGSYFDGKKRNPMLISRRLAEKMKVKLRSKMVLTFQDAENEITAAAFRIVGIFDTGNNIFDDATVFVQRKDINKLLGDEKIAHEIALLLDAPDQTENVKAALVNDNPEWLVETYKEISPEIEMFQQQIKISAIVFTVIVMLGLIFGIINTMLMAVLERIKELGMLMAIGMNKQKVFLMIVLETIFLGLVATPIGLALGYFTVRTLNKTGIDLSSWGEGMKEFGISSIVYPNLQSDVYIGLAFAVTITAVLGAIYPAFKAIRLKPVEALRKI